ncbi:rotamase PTPA-1 [Dactylonectria estremocensis]|uniref:Serine/threonine-protein phosphatase 2A activator n=1 Tax=Dactylonectria estremocensis TaxID=1079267 RepID=A0A9P9F2Y3_9HYPO|nr:rotamase PTPA-1 [Dactylonectria estremocensis]
MASGPPPKPSALEVLDLSSGTPAFTKPTKRINDGPDVARFLTSLAYRDIGTFILQLNRALCPRNQPNSPLPRTFPLTTRPPSVPLPASIQTLQSVLAKIDAFISEAPPDPGPRRFGNVSFRKWYAILEERLDDLLTEGPLREIMQLGEGTAKDEISSYLLGGFGSVQRLDYGTGHELSFVAFLGCLWKLGYFKDGNQGGEIERQIVLQVIEPYLRVVRKLILSYTLEPAGSHGVWGLDDHAFMPYIFGSAQFTRPINEGDTMPTEGSVKGAPKPSDVAKAVVVEDYRQTNMYFAAIGFINDVKTGPFWEHSPILFDISGIRDGWGKINKGMIKMFNAEVLSKFPVVQHFPFGSLFSWDMDPHAATPTQSVHMVNQPTIAAMAPPPPSGAGTAAPWAQATRMPAPPGPGIPYSRVPPPAPSTGSPTPRPAQGNPVNPESTSAQITMTKAPWAR